ncbi:hypothetical protein GCM10023165_50070 [Variovorax defluvii]|uniref:AB hydrolase-1 domain-containing protein n=2 Tax=Variovorax defluvii TaxID=913761 RepID=A0ABP8IDK2_9BURK
MIHGLLGPLDFFDPHTLLPGIDVHAPDLPNYRSQPPHRWGHGDALALKRHAEWIADYIRSHIDRPICLLGHSVGGAIAMLTASLAPDLVRMVINVEGNFTLNDAFWCRRIASLSDDAWEAEYRAMQASPAAWLESGRIEVTGQRLKWAQEILHNQSAATVLAMARAVVRDTGAPEYLAAVKKVVAKGIPVHLVAGERSRDGWDVPPWVRSAAASSVVLPSLGHMMMLEAPVPFCAAIGDIVATAETSPHPP